MTSSRWRQDVLVALIGLALLLAWDGSNADLTLIAAYGNPTGFALRDHWFTRTLMHEGGRALGWATLIALLINLRWPWSPALTLQLRWRWVGITLLCLLLVPGLKQLSSTSCPWDLRLFGGAAEHLSHWRWAVADGGPGRCFPSGHATAAFAFISGWFMLRDAYPRAARIWLVAVIVVGVAFGWAQMARGAHFASHTLWTAWLCWVLCALLAPRQAPAQLEGAKP
jgi:membrane-associated PAP2 superfamily phosphatase